MGSLLLVPGLDTRLARALLERRRVEYPTLHAALTKVRALRRSSPRTLALELVELGLVDASDLEATLAELLGGQGERWKIGESIAGLELLGSLGVGGMGEVFLARDPETGSEVAVKTLRINEDEDLLARFQREAEAQARVDAHPNVVRIHRSGAAGGRAFLVMDAVRGGDLAQRLAQGPLEPRAAAEMVRDLALGLAYAHERGVLHRDLKPANVLFDERGLPRLADFGLARLLEADALTRTGEILGTPSYMAPEQAKSGAQDERTDVYGLGGILYAALTAHPPFAGSTVYALLEQVMTAPAPDPRALAPEVPEGLAALCQRCLAKSPEDRFASALELSAALDASLRGEGEPSPRRPLALALALVAGFAFLALAAGGALSSLGSSARPALASPELARSPIVTDSPLPSEEEVRAQVMKLGPGLERALLAERLLARGLAPKEWLEERAAAPFFSTKIANAASAISLPQERVLAWSDATDFESSHLVRVLDARTGVVERSSSDRFLCASKDGTTLALWAWGGAIRFFDVGSWRETRRMKPLLEVTGAALGAQDLWIVGRGGLRRVPLESPAQVALLWEPPAGEDAAAVQPLPSGEILLASGRGENCPTRLRLISPEGEVRWASPRSNLFDGKVRALEVSPDGRWALLGTASGQIALFSTATEPRGIRKPAHLYRTPLSESPELTAATLSPRAHRDSVVALTWLSNDVFLSADDAPAAFHVWRREGECLARDLGQEFAPTQVSLSPDGKRFFIASRSRGMVTGVLRSSLIPLLD